MSDIVDYGIRETYNSIKSIEKLTQIDPMMDLESLRLIVKELFVNDKDIGRIISNITVWEWTNAN